MSSWLPFIFIFPAEDSLNCPLFITLGDPRPLDDVLTENVPSTFRWDSVETWASDELTALSFTVMVPVVGMFNMASLDSLTAEPSAQVFSDMVKVPVTSACTLSVILRMLDCAVQFFAAMLPVMSILSLPMNMMMFLLTLEFMLLMSTLPPIIPSPAICMAPQRLFLKRLVPSSTRAEFSSVYMA